MFDRFDVCEAYYVFAMDYHDGVWSPVYGIFGRLAKLQFQPSPMLREESLSENGQRILADLVAKQAKG